MHGVFRQEAKPDVLGTQIIPQENLDVVLGQFLDMDQEDLCWILFQKLCYKILQPHSKNISIIQGTSDEILPPAACL
jgi:hypothetical protein